MAAEHLIADDVGEVLAETISPDGRAYLVNPSRETITALVDTLGADDRSTPVRLLSAEQPLKGATEEFLVASTVADLLADGALSVRILDEEPSSSLVVTDDAVVSLVTGPGTAAGLGTDDPSFVEETLAYYEDRWETAGEFTLRTPPLSRVRSTLATEIGSDVRADFDAVLASLPTADGDSLEAVTIALLVGARNRELLYDISKWGEDVGLASKATFSRTKTRLEDAGLIDTEKVPIDVGRPRLRLLLGDDRLRDADIEDLADVAAELLP